MQVFANGGAGTTGNPKQLSHELIEHDMHADAAVACFRPHILRPLDHAWIALGRLLHRVMSPLIMGAIFFLCVSPIAWIMRPART